MARCLASADFCSRTDQQFHWENADYATPSTISWTALASRKRKTIRRERKEALSAGIEVCWLTGSDLTEAVWDAFFAFYMETGSRKWGRPYLTREFFSIVGEKMRDRILLVMARRAGRWIAGAINFIGADTLYGRNWGAIEHHPFLHFELLLLSGHRLRDRAPAEAGRGRRARRAQAGARLPAAHDLFRAFHRQSGPAPGGCRLSGARARLCTGGSRGACSGGAIPQGFGRTGLTGGADAELRSEQHFRQDPARRAALLQSLRGRQGNCLSRHHAALTGPHAGATESACPQYSRYRRRRSGARDDDRAERSPRPR